MTAPDPATILARTAMAIGLAEFERRGKPESVQPRHYADARIALEALASILYTQGAGVRVNMLNTASSLLTSAAHASGPDQADENFEAV